MSHTGHNTPWARDAALRWRRAALAAALLATAACASPEAKLEKYLTSGEKFLAEERLGVANVQFLNALKIDEQNVRALEGLSKIAEMKADFQQMFGILQRINRVDPKNHNARLTLAKLYLMGNDASKSLEFVDALIAENPKDADALAVRAAVMFRVGNNADAIELANKALAIKPRSEEAIAVLASERIGERDLDGAMKILDAAIADDEKASVLQLLRIQLLGELGRTDDINAAYEKLIAAYPDDSNYRRLYATTLISQDKLEAARTQLVEVVRLHPRLKEAKFDVVRADFRIGGREKAEATLRAYANDYEDGADMEFALGAFLREQKDYAAAEAVYIKIIAAKNSEIDHVLNAKNEIAAIRMLQGKRSEVDALVGEILATDAKNPDALVKRSALRIDEGKIDEAIGDLRVVVNERPEHMPARLLLATAFERKGDLNLAERELADAVEASNNAAQPSLLFAKFLLRKSDPARAEKVLAESIAADPSSAENLKLLAAIRLENHNWRGAEEAAEALRAAGEADEDVGRILGAAYAGLKDYAGAIDVLTKENDRAPLAARPLAMLVQAYVDAGRVADAEKFLGDAVEKNPAQYEARVLLGQVRRAIGKDAEAMEALNEAVKVDPLRSEAYEALYGHHVLAGRRDEAGALIERATTALPDNAGLQILKADYLISAGQPDAAIAIYETILAKRANDLIVANNLASLLMEKDDPAATARAVAAVKALEGVENPYMLDTYGWTLYRGGRVEEGIAALEKAVKLEPEMADARLHLAIALKETGAAARAREHLNAVVNSKRASPSLVDEARKLLAGG
jgi:tetratricopeptide (TPR) repeat protein